MKKEVNPKETTRARAFELWMKAPNPMVTFFKTIDVAAVRGNAILIQSSNGTLNIRGAADGTSIGIYTTSGVMIGSAKSTGTSTSIATDLRKGEIAIVKIGNKSVKVVMK